MDEDYLRMLVLDELCKHEDWSGVAIPEKNELAVKVLERLTTAKPIRLDFSAPSTAGKE